jgi:hypothetical protein
MARGIEGSAYRKSSLPVLPGPGPAILLWAPAMLTRLLSRNNKCWKISSPRILSSEGWGQVISLWVETIIHPNGWFAALLATEKKRAAAFPVTCIPQEERAKSRNLGNEPVVDPVIGAGVLV